MNTFQRTEKVSASNQCIWLTWIMDAAKKAIVRRALGKVLPPFIRWMAVKKMSWPGMTSRRRTWADRWFGPATSNITIRVWVWRAWPEGNALFFFFFSSCITSISFHSFHFYLNQRRCDKGCSTFSCLQEPPQVGNSNADWWRYDWPGWTQGFLQYLHSNATNGFYLIKESSSSAAMKNRHPPLWDSFKSWICYA